jgi:hypothetical protein
MFLVPRQSVRSSAQTSTTEFAEPLLLEMRVESQDDLAALGAIFRAELLVGAQEDRISPWSR